ncbi:MAG: hypothetical protein ACF8OB_14605 [Phycisphaeraceae bacterium JB051]
MARILVLETTGCLTYGIVAQSGSKGTLRCSAPAMSAASDISAAVNEVLDQLREQTKRKLPSSAVLVSSSAVSDLLFLPVAPRNPRPREQMNELIRWEFEEVYVRQSDMWSLGALLQGKGHITADQRRQIEAGDVAGSRRVSVADAYRSTVSSQQFQDALALQESLVATDDELALGWCAQSQNAEDGRYAWHCAGIGISLRSQWVKALKNRNITCNWVYPQLGAALPLMDTQTDGLLIDIQQEIFGLYQIVNGHVDSITTQPCLHGMPEPDTVALAVAKFMQPDTQVVHVLADDAAYASIEHALVKMLRSIKVQRIELPQPPVESSPCPTSVLASMQGAAMHALKQCPVNRLPRIEAQPPKPAAWKNRELWPWAIIALMIIAFGCLETYTRFEAHEKEIALEDLDIEYEYRLRLQKEAQEMRSQIHNMEKVHEAKLRELDQLHHRINVLNNIVLNRQKLVPGLLQAVGNAVTQGVVLDRLEESKDRSGMTLEGWAMKDTNAQQFAKRLNQNLAQWNYVVGTFELSRGKGRYGIDGFNLKARLIRKSETNKEGHDDQ